MDGVSIAASLVGLGTAGYQVAIKLYTLASQVKNGSERISALSNDISLTSGVLKELGDYMVEERAKTGATGFNQSGLEITQNSATVCEGIFIEIEKAAKKASKQLSLRNRIIGQVKLSRSERAKWPFLEPAIESRRDDLREAKLNLMLMLQILNGKSLQRIAVSHETTWTSIDEQRESYRAILAIKKQLQDISSSRIRQTSSESPVNNPLANTSLPSPSGHTNLDAASSYCKETTRVSPSLASPVAVHPQDLMAIPASFTVPASTEATSKTLDSNATKSDDRKSHNGVESQSDWPGQEDSNTPQIKAAENTLQEPQKILDFFVIKAAILENSTVSIVLELSDHKIPLQQVNIYKQLSRYNEENVQPIIDTYMELFEYERDIIRDRIQEISSPASLVLLKRTYKDITHRGILFKGIPELQFILESLKEKDLNRGSKVATPRLLGATMKETIGASIVDGDPIMDGDEPILLQGCGLPRSEAEVHTSKSFNSTSDDSDEESLGSNDTMDYDEAERAVNELLGKYTTSATLERST